MSEQKAEAEVVAGIVQELAKAEFRTIEHDGLSAPIAVLPRGLAIHSMREELDKYRNAPVRRTGTAFLTEIESFIAHVNRFKDESSVVFCDKTAPSLTCVLDYHPAGSASAPRFGKHRSQYAFPHSDEWKTWLEHDDQDMSQGDFASWIEDRILDVLDPARAGATALEFVEALQAPFANPARLMELSRGLDVRVKTKVANAVRLNTGEVQVNFESEHTDERGQPLRVPQAFLIAIPPFQDGAFYQVPVRLRYRVVDAKVVWRYVLYRTDKVLDAAIDETCDRVEAETGLPLLKGKPE